MKGLILMSPAVLLQSSIERSGISRSGRNVPGQFKRTVHGKRKVFPKRREQQRTIVFDPIVPARVDELCQSFLAVIERVRCLEMLVGIPFLVVTSLRWQSCACLLCGNSEEEVDCGLLIIVLGCVREAAFHSFRREAHQEASLRRSGANSR